MFKIIHRIRSYIYKQWFIYIYTSQFKTLGKNALLYSPFRIDGISGICMGERSVFQRGAWLYCIGIDNNNAVIEVGKGCVFGYNNHITAIKKITIGENVLTANNVYISDNIHGYENIGIPIIDQPLIFKSEVEIGSGSWLGENVVVIGAKIGKNCVIGANAVVTSDIPDYSVAVGIPARVIKKFDTEKGHWIAINIENSKSEQSK